MKRIKTVFIAIVILGVVLNSGLMGNKCGFPQLMTRKAKGKAILGGRPELNYSYETEHFKIWYNKTGVDAVDTTDYDSTLGIPEWVANTARICEHCWSVEVETLGFKRPLPDSTFIEGVENVGGDNRVDVYITNIDSLYYGRTGLDTTRGNKATGFLEIGNDYSESQYDEYRDNLLYPLRVTIAHEFFHLIQSAYDYTEKLWWMEATAVWMEEVVYDEVNDYYNYLPAFFNFPQHPLTFREESHIYGAVIFPIFLQERMDYEVIKDTWSLCGEGVPVLSSASPSALDSALSRKGFEFNDIFFEFSYWNIFTGDFADTSKYYSEGNKYPEVEKNEKEVFSDNTRNFYLSFEPGESLRSMYYKVPSDSIGEYVSLKIRKEGFAQRAAGFVSYDSSSFAQEFPIILEESRLTPDDPLVFFYAIGKNKSNDDDSVFITLTNLLKPSEEYYPYPNPFNFDGDDSLIIPFHLNRRATVSLIIYSSAGRIVYEDKRQNQPEGAHTLPSTAFTWEAQNKQGRNVSSGIYIIQTYKGTDKIGEYKIFLNNKAD